MNYTISKPSKYLSQYIKQYWQLESFVPAGQEHIQRIIPNGLFELIFYFKDKPIPTDDRKVINDNIMVTGQLKNHYDLKITGNLSLFAIYFLPHGLSMFLDLPIKELFNQSIPLKHLIKGAGSKLEDELYEAGTFRDRIDIAEKFLMHQLQKNEKKYKYERIRSIINRINQTKGIIKVNDLAATSFLSRKQFERTFLEIIGISPKQFLKIVRFQNTLYERSKTNIPSLTEIAHSCGYFDQAHMINDFKTMTGMSPKKFFAEGIPFSDYFNG